MNFKKLYTKLFISGDWQMAYRQQSQHWPFDYGKAFIAIPNNRFYWYADPFLVNTGSCIYLFCEAFNKKKQIGELAVMTYMGDGQWTEPKVIVSNDYHMSYPCVFQVDGEYYMIPETSEAETLELYIADEFPYSWSKCCNLLENVHLVDPTVFCCDGAWNLIAYDETGGTFKTRVFQIDIDRKTCVEQSSVLYADNSGRPAGYMMPLDDCFIRPVQDSRRLYGESILWNKCCFHSGEMNEVCVGELDNDRVRIISNDGDKRIHTYSTCDGLEVIDYNVCRFDFFKRIKILNRQIKRNRRMLGRR